MRETVSFAELSEYQRAEVHRHLAQTYGMNYGGLERVDALMFRLSPGDPAVIRSEPEAVLLRELRDAAVVGGSVKTPRLGKPAAVRMSELLRQSADRAGREGRDGQVTQFLASLWRDWDAARKVPADEYQRAELVAYRGAI